MSETNTAGLAVGQKVYINIKRFGIADGDYLLHQYGYDPHVVDKVCRGGKYVLKTAAGIAIMKREVRFENAPPEPPKAWRFTAEQLRAA